MSRETTFRTRSLAGPIFRAASATIDTLENRQMFNVTLDSAGWSVVDHVGATDFRTIYVSNSTGNNAWDGLSAVHVDGTNTGPKSTLASATSLMRSGKADWLLLKKGDAWNETLYANNSGPNAQNPQFFGSYGTGSRPVVYGNGGTGLGSTARNNVAVIGIEFYNRTADPANASFNAATDGSGTINFGGRNILVEDCYFNFRGVVAQGTGAYRHNDLAFRRNTFANAYSTTSAHMQGLYVSSVDRVKIEDNVFFRSGWNPIVPGAEPTIYNHAIYLQWSTYEAELSGNIIIQPSSVGAQVRGGGVVDNNLFIDSEYAFFTSQKPSIARENVVMSLTSGDSTFLNAQPVSQAGIQNFSPYQVTEGNIVANRLDVSGRTAKVAYELNPERGPNSVGASPASSGQGYYDNPASLTLFRNNIDYNWGSNAGTSNNGATTLISGNYFADLDYTGNTVIQKNFTAGAVRYSPSTVSGNEHFDNNTYHNPLAPAAKQYQLSSTYYTAAAWQAKFKETDATLADVPFIDPNRSAVTYLRDVAALPLADANTVYSLLLQRDKDNWNDGQLTAGKINDYVRDGFRIQGQRPQASASLANNTGARVSSGAGVTIATDLLKVSAPRGTTADTLFFVEQLPGHGTLRLNNAKLLRFMTFTQADIDAGRLTYENNGDSATADGFVFRASDGKHGTVDKTTFAFTITPPEVPAIGSFAVTNNVPQVTDNQTFYVNENAAVNTVLGRVAGSDIDAGQKTTWTIDGYQSDDLFRVDPNTGDLRVQYFSASYGSGFAARTVNFEATQTYTMTLRLTDDATQTGTVAKTVTVIVRDLNEAPVVPAVTTDLGEEAVAGVRVGGVTATDPDANDVLTYAIVAGNTAGKFTVDGVGGVFLASPVAYSTASQYIITVRATDKGGLKTDAKMTINVKARPVLTTDLGAALNAEQTNVITTAQLRVTDADTAAANLVYTLDGTPALGDIKFNGKSLAPGATFTQADIDAGRVAYAHRAGAAAGVDAFAFMTRDERGVTVSGTFMLTVTDAPPVITSPAAAVLTSPTDALSPARVALSVFAADDRAAGLTYTWSTDAVGVRFPDNNGTTRGGQLDVALPGAGTYTFNVNIFDGVNAPVTSSVTVTYTIFDVPIGKPGRTGGGMIAKR